LSVKAGKKIMVSVSITNIGKMDGEEVAQLYVSNESKNIKAPLKALKGFKRISLKAGESRVVQFDLSPQDMSIVDENGLSKQVKGKVMISVGGGQPGEKIKTTSNVLKAEVNVN
jgi:beta-glucosidase